MGEIATARHQLTSENPELVEASREYYRDEMEYHNFDGHVLGAWEVARRIASVCMTKGHEVDLMVLDADVLFHDSNVHVPLAGQRFKTAERRSASIARRILPSLEVGYSPGQVKQVSGDIISTTRGVTPTTLEGVILNRADLANVGSGVGAFLDTSAKVVREHIRINGLSLNLSTVRNWLAGAPGALLGLLDDMHEVPGFDLDAILEEDPSFYERGLRNVSVLANQSVGRFVSLIRSDET